MGSEIIGIINCSSKKLKNKFLSLKSTSNTLIISPVLWLYWKIWKRQMSSLNNFCCRLKKISVSIIILIYKIISSNQFNAFQSMYSYSNFSLKRHPYSILIIKTFKLSFTASNKSTQVTTKNSTNLSIISN